MTTPQNLSTIERHEIVIGKRHGKRAAQYRTVNANGSAGAWFHLSVKEAEIAQRSGQWIDHPATVRVLP